MATRRTKRKVAKPKGSWIFSDANFLACPLYRWEGERGRCRWCNDLLTGAQRKWCSHQCYDSSSTQHRWTQARKAALRRDGFKCRTCGDSGPRAMLEVNHEIPILGRHAENGCHHHVTGLSTLCHSCHVKVTRQQRAQGLIPARNHPGQGTLL